MTYKLYYITIAYFFPLYKANFYPVILTSLSSIMECSFSIALSIPPT